MISIEEMQMMLDEIAEGFPQEFYEELNGGIELLPDIKRHNKGLNNDLFILGEYHRGGSMGRYITIYYGSFMRVYGHLSYGQIKEKLSNTVKHEFRHHIESLAGERDLEILDSQYIADYLTGKDGGSDEYDD
jgi:hypothetical protein